MTNKQLQTTRFSFQKIGVSQELEVADYNTILDAIDNQLPGSAHAAADFTAPAAGVVASAAVNESGVQRVRLTLTAAEVDATNANKYGSLALFTWPNSNILVVGARMNLTGTKDGVQIQAADQPTVALGSVAASNTTLSSTMIDTVDIVTLAATLAAAAQKNGTAAPATLRNIAAGATNKVFLNIGATGNTGGGDGNVKFTGTIDVFFLDKGLFS